MKLIKLIVCLLVFSSSAKASSFEWFNDKPIYREPYAYVRTPDSGVTLNSSEYLEQQVGYIEVSLGKNVPIVTMKSYLFGQPLILQTGLAGGMWLTLGYKDGAFPLLTEDFFISAPLEFKLGRFSGAIKFNHISAHQGDGLDGVLEDKLSKNDKSDLDQAEDILQDIADDDDVGIVLQEPFSYSRDFFSGHIAFDGRMGLLNTRVYAHGGYAHKIIPKVLNRWFLGSGFEALYPSGIFSPYYAQDITWNGDTDSADLSLELGSVLVSDETKYYTLRVAFTAYIGNDRRGQLIKNRMKQFGFGFFIY